MSLSGIKINSTKQGFNAKVQRRQKNSTLITLLFSWRFGVLALIQIFVRLLSTQLKILK